MNLYEPQRHVHLPPIDWDPGRARGWLQRWSEAALEGWARDGRWPMHPRDAEVGDAPTPMHNLYFGALGVWLALFRLAEAGHCGLPARPAELLRALYGSYLRTPDLGERFPSWFLGESALLTALCLAEPDPGAADRLAGVIRGNRENPTREALWGAPGTMVAALFMHESTADERWAALFRDSADALWSTWQLDEASGAWLWEQDLYGSRARYLGAGHGWAGNLYPLWRGQALLDDERRRVLRERTLQGLQRLARVEGELVNWAPMDAGEKMLVQWCHGAPGFITSLRHADLPGALPLLLGGARLVVRAGPLVKGPGLCHGTDGNGAALLEVHRRTGDPVWLTRAREFAMWAIDQSDAERERHGQWRHSLWTGDAGLACYLLDCLDGGGRGLPGMDYLW